jgi:hypothetical protein
MNRFGPFDPAREKKPVYTVTVAKPDGSDAKDVYTEAEHGFGSIDWGRAAVPAPASADKPNEEAVAAPVKALRPPSGTSGRWE